MDQTYQWERLKDLFAAALELDASEREAFLIRECGSDRSLRTELESLLAAHDSSDSLSRGLAGDSLEGAGLAHDAQPEQTIGPYRLVRKIGEGGMGQVWLAEQTEPLHREVALKLLLTRLFDDSLLQRFQAERQSLAVMEHPAIARVFDAGMTVDGQPWIVMEYVPGEPITRFCDSRRLSLEDRVEIFARVCDGVQHAHQKAIIHRDLKPANILVLEIDGQPAPRIIDFGLARAAQAEPHPEGAPLALETIAGTPGYMSPEQLAGGDIDTRADVYSLGVVLFELLTGQLPFDRNKLELNQHDLNRPELNRDAAPLASARAGVESATAAIAAQNRGLPQRRLVGRLRGDLDCIVARALQADPARRFASPSELAADLRRWLRHLAVESHPGGAAYHLRKYVRRHRLGAAMAALVALLLVAFAVLQAINLRRIARERDRAARITDFMIRSFRVSDPGEARGNQVTAREILDKASDRIGTELKSDPEIQSDMMMTMGAVYENLGLYERSESLYRQALDIRERQLGVENTDTLKAKASLAWTLYRRGHYDDAAKLLREVLAVRMRRSGANNTDTISVMNSLGAVLNDLGQAKEAEALERQVVDFRLRTNGELNADTLVSMNHLSLALQNEGRWKEAEDLDRRQVEDWKKVEGDGSPRGLSAADNLAIILYREGRLADAEALDRATLETKKRVLGLEHPETVRSMNTLSAVLSDEGRLEEAQPLCEQVVAIRTRVLGPEHPLTLSATENLAEILMHRGDLRHAEELMVKVRAESTRVLGANHPATAMATYNFGCLALRQGHREQALELLRESVDHGMAAWLVKAMPQDPDLAQLRGDPKFDELIQYADAQHGIKSPPNPAR